MRKHPESSEKTGTPLTMKRNRKRITVLVLALVLATGAVARPGTAAADNRSSEVSYLYYPSAEAAKAGTPSTGHEICRQIDRDVTEWSTEKERGWSCWG